MIYERKSYKLHFGVLNNFFAVSFQQHVKGATIRTEVFHRVLNEQGMDLRTLAVCLLNSSYGKPWSHWLKDIGYLLVYNFNN